MRPRSRLFPGFFRLTSLVTCPVAKVRLCFRNFVTILIAERQECSLRFRSGIYHLPLKNSELAAS